jgi:hypothetical protein
MQVTSSPLNPQIVTRIQAWLRTSESIEFRKLISSLALLEEVDALKSLRESDADDGYRADGIAKLEMAKRYEFILTIMDAAAFGHTPGKDEEKFPYTTVSIEQPNAAATVQALLEKSKTK